ncbi:hypothetical protein GN958_ATG01119 [Phytophthora infestans]|uniref:SWIM-type domain-containing protein n=1 Tax=Phytophthora infestans TaxID=4787 RepID=A0A8S9VAP4_PHYIN|nr:hypothetical protein GN958_ATG01119 [Phytophthora infestans]
MLRIGVTRHAEYDEEMNRLLNKTTDHAAELVFPGYAYATKISSIMAYKQTRSNVFLVSSNGRGNLEYTVDTENWDCTCSFSRTMLLPCQHVIYFRRMLNKTPVIPIDTIHQRWRTYYDMLDATDVEPVQNVQVKRMKYQPYVLDERLKWRKFKAMQDEVTEVAVANGTQRFRQLYAALEAFLGIIEASGVPLISEAPWTQRKDSNCSDTGIQKCGSDEDERVPETQPTKPDESRQKPVAVRVDEPVTAPTDTIPAPEGPTEEPTATLISAPFKLNRKVKVSGRPKTTKATRAWYPKQAKPSTSKIISLEYESSEESDNCMTFEQYKPGPMSFELVCDAPYELFTYNGWYDLVMSIPIVRGQTMVVPTAYKIQKEDYSRLPVRGKVNVLSVGLVKLATKAVTSYKKTLEREAKDLA